MGCLSDTVPGSPQSRLGEQPHGAPVIAAWKVGKGPCDVAPRVGLRSDSMPGKRLRG